MYGRGKSEETNHLNEVGRIADGLNEQILSRLPLLQPSLPRFQRSQSAMIALLFGFVPADESLCSQLTTNQRRSYQLHVEPLTQFLTCARPQTVGKHASLHANCWILEDVLVRGTAVFLDFCDEIFSTLESAVLHHQEKEKITRQENRSTA